MVRVIIPASGSGDRFGGKIPKQFIKIGGKEIIAYTIEGFQKVRAVDEIIISARPEHFLRINSIIIKNNFTKVKKITKGGERRQDSVYGALINSDGRKGDIILIHDAVRPFVGTKLIETVIETARKEKCVVPGIPVSDTVKLTGKGNFVSKTIDRSNLRLIQTPQAFRYEVLLQSFEHAFKYGIHATDESSIAEQAGFRVRIIDGEKSNTKITVREDLKHFSIIRK